MGKTTKKPAPVRHYNNKVKLGQKSNKKPRRRAPTEVSYLTVREKDRFFAAVHNPRDRAIFRLLYHHGLRASEIGRMDLSDFRPGSKIELDRIYIRRLKGSISGETAAVPAAAQAIRAWIRKRGHADGPLFITREKTRISRGRVFQLMRKYCAVANIPKQKSHPHTMKHSCATHLVSDRREAIIEVQKHLGHASISSTMVYAQLTNEANEARAKRLREWK